MYIQAGEGLAREPRPNSLGAWATSTLDAATNGKLYWFNSKNGGSTTAVFVPDAAVNTDPLNLLVWIHGDTICGDEGKNAISYVKGKTFPLARQIATSKRPFVLVVPTMHWKSGQNSHTLGAPQKMNAFLEEVRDGLSSAGWAAAPSFGRLILAGHSRGYAVLNGLATRVSDQQSSQGALATLTDVWLFDTTYGKRHKQIHCTNWLRWARAKSNVRLHIFYRRNSGTAAVAECIRNEAAAAGLANIAVKDFDPRLLSHCAMPRDRLPDLLVTSGNYPAPSKSPGSPASSAPSAPPRPANGPLSQQIQNALARRQWHLGLELALLAGIRDENKLANMVFFARHPERGGRKIAATEPNFKQLSREWVDIRDRLVRPFLEKQTAALERSGPPLGAVVGEPITSGPEFEAERAEFEKQKRRFELARERHQQRLAPLPLDVLPLQVLKKAGLKTTTRVSKTTAALIQDALERSRVLRPYIGPKLRRVLIPAKFIHHNSDAEFDAAYVKLHKIVIPVGSSQEKELKTRRGFYHPQTDTIHLRPATDLGHALHEAIHKFASPGFRTTFGSFLDEGVTQYFTDLVLQEQGLDRMKRHSYQKQLECGNKLVALFRPELVARAYFQGATGLANTVARRLNINLLGLYRLRKGDALCQRLNRLRP